MVFRANVLDPGTANWLKRLDNEHQRSGCFKTRWGVQCTTVVTVVTVVTGCHSGVLYLPASIWSVLHTIIYGKRKTGPIRPRSLRDASTASRFTWHFTTYKRTTFESPSEHFQVKIIGSGQQKIKSSSNKRALFNLKKITSNPQKDRNPSIFPLTERHLASLWSRAFLFSFLIKHQETIWSLDSSLMTLIWAICVVRFVIKSLDLRNGRSSEAKLEFSEDLRKRLFLNQIKTPNWWFRGVF